MIIETKFFVTYKGEIKNISKDDFYKISKTYPYYFIPYVPDYRTEEEVKANCFDTENELVEFLKFSYSDEKYTLCMDGESNIKAVSKNGRYWGIIGNTNLKRWALPNWKDYRKTEKNNLVVDEILAVYVIDRYGNYVSKIYDAKEGKEWFKNLQTPTIIYPKEFASNKNSNRSYLQTTKPLYHNADFALKNPSNKINEPIFINISKKYPKP